MDAIGNGQSLMTGIAVLMLVALMACTGSNAPPPTPTMGPQPTIPPQFATFTEEHGWFRVSYPSEWTIVDPNVPEALEVDVSKLEKGGVIIGAFSAGMLDAAARLDVIPTELLSNASTLQNAVKSILDTMEGLSIVSETNTFVGNKEAIIVDAKLAGYGQSQRRVNVFVLEHKVVWWMGCAAPPESFPQVEETCNQVVRSLRILTPFPAGPEFGVIVISTDLALGANRVIFGVVDREGMPVRAPQAQVQAAYFVPGQEATEVRASAIAQFMRWPTGSQGIFSTNLELDTPGFWQLEVSVVSEDRGLVEAVGAFQVKEKSDTPSIGDPAPASVTPTLAGVADIATITSSPVPDPDLYRLSVHQALEARKPLVVVFATPAFCVTATCGPQVQVVSQLKERFQDQANFIHVEVFEDPHLIEGGRPAGGFVPSVAEWNLPTEPWTFVLDQAGRVRAKFEAFTTEEELASALEEVLKSQS